MTLLLRDPTAEIASTLRPRRSPLETLGENASLCSISAKCEAMNSLIGWKT